MRLPRFRRQVDRMALALLFGAAVATALACVILAELAPFIERMTT